MNLWNLNINKGFTLIELLLVILIISVTLGISNPLFRNTFNTIKLNSTGQEIASLIRYAQEQAITQKSITRFNLDVGEGNYRLTQKGGAAEVFTALEGKFGKTYSIPQDIKVKSQQESIDFYPDGEATSALIKLTNSNVKSLTITVNPNTGNCSVTSDEQNQK